MTRVLLFGVAAFATAAAWVLVLPTSPMAQPLAFNHAVHTTNTACVTCHAGVERAARAQFPAGAVCVRCHAAPPGAVSPEAWTALQADGPGAWRRVTQVPDHVMFSHQRHVTLARLECASCHGDIGARTQPPPRAPVRLDMDACLSCHQREGVSQDCTGCHR